MIDPHPGVPDDAYDRPNLALQSLGAIAIGHTAGHRCSDGLWWNPRQGTRPECDTLRRLNLIRTQIERLITQVHDAAHTPRHVDAVAQGMTGLDLTDLGPDDTEGLRQLARHAIESLAYSLETSDQLTERAAAVQARHA